MGTFRVVKRRGFWRVQERGRWWWKCIGPFGVVSWGRWKDSADALWFANLCERVDARQ